MPSKKISMNRTYYVSRDHSNSSVKYAMKGYRLCQNGFLEIIQLYPCTLQRHAADVSSKFSIEAYKKEQYNSRKGKFSVQTTIAVAFWDVIGTWMVSFAQKGEFSPMNNFSGAFLVALLKKYVYKEYEKNWAELTQGSVPVTDQSERIPLPLTDTACLKVCRSH